MQRGQEHIRRLNQAEREKQKAEMKTENLKFLFFDTETTGKCDFRAPPDAPHQPRLVQLAALLTDGQGKEIASLNVIARPEGFTIPAEASAVHGITTEFALENGAPLGHVVAMFCALAEISSAYVCHNAEFDLLVMTGEMLRLTRDFPSRPACCTMKSMTEVCRLPGPYGYKWPKLQEAYRHCCGREFDGAHDALADVRACREIFFWQRRQEAEARKRLDEDDLDYEQPKR